MQGLIELRYPRASIMMSHGVPPNYLDWCISISISFTHQSACYLSIAQVWVAESFTASADDSEAAVLWGTPQSVALLLYTKTTPQVLIRNKILQVRKQLISLSNNLIIIQQFVFWSTVLWTRFDCIKVLQMTRSTQVSRKCHCLPQGLWRWNCSRDRWGNCCDQMAKCVFLITLCKSAFNNKGTANVLFSPGNN